MKTEEQRQHFVAHNLRKRCTKKNFEGIHDRFQKDLRFRDSQLTIDRTEEICIQMDEVAQKDFTYRMSSDEFVRYKKKWISLNTSGRNAPMKIRSDFSEALTKIPSVVFFIQHIMVAVERCLVELIKFIKVQHI